jgi:uncharacterized Zn finger protein (UPF0148 family)
MAAAKKPSRDELSKRLADKMLLGWSMLADLCPVPLCHAPLMKDTDGQMWCISCDRRVMTEDDLKAEIDRSAAMTASGRSASAGAMAESESDRAARLLRIQQAAVAEPPSALAKAASTVGKPKEEPKPKPKPNPKPKRELTARELMESIEPTEEERSLGSYAHAVVEQEPASLEQMLGVRPKPPPAAAQAAAPAEPVRNGHMPAERQQVSEPEPQLDGGSSGAVISSSDISAQLSDLLLKGWRMLEEECPVTAACPLMQQKSTGRKFSVALQKFIDELDDGPDPAATIAADSPAEAAASRSKQDQLQRAAERRQSADSRAAQARQQQATASAAAATAAAAAPTSIDLPAARRQPGRPLDGLVPEAARHSPPAAAATATATATDIATAPAAAGGSGALDGTIATLSQKIVEAARRLDQPPEEPLPVSERILLAQLIGECAASIHALETLR